MQALIATSIALSVAGLATLANVETKVVAARQSIGKAQGKQLDVLASASDNYTIQNFAVLTSGSGQIQKADGSAGAVVSPLSPTVQELVTLGFLQANFNATNYYGGGYKVSLGKLPFGCSYPNCSIGGTVSLTNAMTRPNGVVDYSTLGTAVQQIGADAGYSTAASAGTISGLSGGWSQTNPAGSVAGILGERVGQGAQRYMAFLRRDGTLPMTGTLNMGGQGITGVKQVVTGSACVTKGDWADDSTSGAPVYCNGTPGTYVAISGGANWVRCLSR